MGMAFRSRMSNVIVDKLSVAVVLSLVALAAGHPSHVAEVSKIFADDGSFARRILGDNDLQISHCPGKEVQEQSFQRASFGTSFIEAADLELGTEEVTGSFNKKSAKKAAKKAAKNAAKAAKKAAKKKAEEKAANMSVNRKLVKWGVLTKGCVATQKTLDAVNAMVPYTGTGKHPRWDFKTACRDAKGNLWYLRKARPNVKCKRTLATISCPCDGSNGRPLSATQAMSKILGQLGAMPTKLNALATARKINTMRIGLASIRMLRCWQNVCKQEKSVKKKTADQSLDELLVDVGRPDGDLDAGWDCG